MLKINNTTIPWPKVPKIKLKQFRIPPLITHFTNCITRTKMTKYAGRGFIPNTDESRCREEWQEQSFRIAKHFPAQCARGYWNYNIVRIPPAFELSTKE